MKASYPEQLIRIFIIYLASCFCLRQSFAQSYYPGGLGNANLLIWLNANKSSSITKNGSNQVSQWSDLSGNGYHFSQATAANQPVYGATAAPNGRPGLTFTSTSSQYLALASLPSSISFAGGISTFTQVSFNASQTSWGWERIYDFGNGQASNNLTFGRKGSTANFYYEGFIGSTGDQTYTTTSPIVNGSSNIYEAVQQGAPPGNYTAVKHYLAGTLQAGSGASGTNTWVPASIARTKNYIGHSNWAVDDYFSGTMSEILIYKTAFNTTQRVIMENYLSAEWNQAVGVSRYTPATTTTYGTNLVGVGYTSSTDYFLTNPAGATDGFGFSSGIGATDFLNTAGYLMAAHNGQSNTTLSNVSIYNITSASSISRWNRSWKLQKTAGNATGVVTINFNFSDYNGTTPSSANTYGLLFNATDGTFASGFNDVVTTVSTPTVSGNIVSFVVNAANLANGYYTIIYSSTPLPVQLTGFTASRQGNSTLLKWNVAQETNMDHYEIQRGVNAADISTIGEVPINGNSSLPTQYSYWDSKPATGMNYYRLKMVDRDGASTYSIIVPVSFPVDHAVAMSLFPNPVVDRLHIMVTDPAGVISALIIDARGQVVRTVTSAASEEVDVPVSDLSKGIYIVEVRAGAAKYVQKILKN
ncbi:T9SS type A sorting domain-containing protein [Flavitalea sp. BT771]|uniref:T9SS type A sorting domain-containing protein n=1 Tax=Flavitalea sp. BT771 TaxID=3063329 RepID=UPI0026E45558|nr:T9SS type A sorting domain-containing protein [Flavitalea sp. BT771]MDO6434739.1 T9SS type A sorting domain-containing protein [Flavitalea sp. BT771]MDV6223639.1 T9SS type A sorting domain-containing protein [Flavitalea sp. BT771]